MTAGRRNLSQPGKNLCRPATPPTSASATRQKYRVTPPVTSSDAIRVASRVQDAVDRRVSHHAERMVPEAREAEAAISHLSRVVANRSGVAAHADGVATAEELATLWDDLSVKHDQGAEQEAVDALLECTKLMESENAALEWFLAKHRVNSGSPSGLGQRAVKGKEGCTAWRARLRMLLSQVASASLPCAVGIAEQRRLSRDGSRSTARKLSELVSGNTALLEMCSVMEAEIRNMESDIQRLMSSPDASDTIHPTPGLPWRLADAVFVSRELLPETQGLKFPSSAWTRRLEELQAWRSTGETHETYVWPMVEADVTNAQRGLSEQMGVVLQHLAAGARGLEVGCGHNLEYSL